VIISILILFTKFQFHFSAPFWNIITCTYFHLGRFIKFIYRFQHWTGYQLPEPRLEALHWNSLNIDLVEVRIEFWPKLRSSGLWCHIVLQYSTSVSIKMEAAGLSKMLHGVTTQKTLTWNFTPVKTSNLAWIFTHHYVADFPEIQK